MHGMFIRLALVGLIEIVPDAASARGGPLHLFGPFNEKPIAVLRAGAPEPSIVPSDALGGCGRGRYRDLKTHACRGPADVMH